MTFGANSVRSAFEIALAAMSPALDIAWQNKEYVPTPNRPYQLVYMLLADPDNAEMHRAYREQGYFQVTLRYPINVGPKDAELRAQLLRDYFYRGLSLTSNGATLTINRTPSIGNGTVDGDRWTVPVKIRFIAQAT